MEVMYGIDTIEIDDNHFAHIEEVTDRERNFMNHKSVRFLEDFKNDFVDHDRKNNPIFAIMF